MSRKRKLCNTDAQACEERVMRMLRTEDLLAYLEDPAPRAVKATLEHLAGLASLHRAQKTRYYLEQMDPVHNVTLLERIFQLFTNAFALDAKQRKSTDSLVATLLEALLLPSVADFPPDTRLSGAENHNAVTYMLTHYSWGASALLTTLFESFLSAGCDVNHRTAGGLTPIVITALQGTHGIVTYRQLIEVGAHVGLDDSNGDTLLHHLARTSQVNLVQELFETHFTTLECLLSHENNAGQRPHEVALHANQTWVARMLCCAERAAKTAILPFRLAQLEAHLPSDLCQIVLQYISS